MRPKEIGRLKSMTPEENWSWHRENRAKGTREKTAEEQLVAAALHCATDARMGEGVTPTHAGVHPDDLDQLAYAFPRKEEEGWVWFYPYWLGALTSVEKMASLRLVADGNVPRGHASVTDAEGAFLRGYTEEMP